MSYNKKKNNMDSNSLIGQYVQIMNDNALTSTDKHELMRQLIIEYYRVNPRDNYREYVFKIS